jgi:hypothetical protein
LTLLVPGTTFDWVRNTRTEESTKTLSLKLPDALDDELETLAAQRRTSKSAVIREALSGYLGRNGSASRVSFAALAGDLAGCVEGPDDLSANRDHLAGYGR